MQNFKILTLILTLLFTNLSLTVKANNIDVRSFYELMNSYPGNGDTINILNDLSASSTIGYDFYGLNIKFEGGNHSINGNYTYGGFVLNQDSLLNQIELTNCKGQEYNRSNFAGALYNSGGNIEVENSIFKGNFADSNNINFAIGGAIYNLNGGTMTINNTDFQNNYTNGASSYGGAITNGYQSGPQANMTITNSIFRNNYAEGSVVERGGALYNNGKVTITESTFNNNSAIGETGNYVSAGAIYNEGSAEILKSEIINNTAKSVDYGSITGGAIYNTNELTISDTTINNNTGTANNDALIVGGAIYNTGTTTIKNSNITSNKAQGNDTVNILAGAIYNNNQLQIIDSSIKSNLAIAGENSNIAGGAIYNLGTETINNSEISNNITQGGANTNIKGGAIFNNGTLELNSSTISDNTIETNGTGEGGAIYNNTNGTITINDSNITNNKISASTQTAEGGAIYNNGTLELNSSTVSDNTIETNGSGEGGAIYNNTNGTITIKNSNIANNKISTSAQNSEGGGIYNSGNIIIENSNFENNLTSNGEKNDIYNNNGTISFTGEGTTNILSGISGTGKITKEGTGILNLGGTNNNYNGDFNFEQGTLNLLANSSYFNAQNTTLANNTNFNMQNNQIDNINFGNLTSNGITNFNVDAYISQREMDTISANNFTGNGTLFVRNIALDGVPEAQNITLPFANNTLKSHVKYNPTTISSPIYDYQVRYESSSGNFSFTRGEFNPEILSTSVATQLGGYLVQLETYKNIFANYDMLMIGPQNLQKGLSFQNKTASNSGQFALSPLLMPEQRRGIWVKPYTTFENVPLKNGPDVSNVIYGTIVGGDSELKKLKNNWYNTYGAYVSYNGSHQAYQGNSTYSNGGLFGLNTAFYKGKFFSAWTANVGANSAENNNNYGKDNFAMLSAGIAQKTGYNFELLENKLIIQPSVITSYSFINTFDYTTASNVSISTSPLHALHVEPGIKIIGNFKNYIQPYLSVSFAWNLIDHTNFKANDIALNDLSVKPYVQYGVGIQKRWGERFTGFLEGMIRNGGRNGIALLFGFRISI